ncbi:MAG: hypothetical protein H6737_06790 [Alphaproteobacteria bacterium]|nr:hypothetical protein [Alphaproteobacteria bacterium]
MRRAAVLLSALAVGCVPPGLTRNEWDWLSELRWVEPGPEMPANAEGNPLWDDPAAQRLGRRLYFDRGLSANGEVSCDDCHDAAGSGAQDGVPVSISIAGQPSKNAPTLFNVGIRQAYGWAPEQEATVLWQQITRPLTRGLQDDSEDHVAAYTCDQWGLEYRAVFGRPCTYPRDVDGPLEDEATRITEDVAKALAAYVRTLESKDSAFDRFMGSSFATHDPTAMSESAQHGAQLFVGDGFCTACHIGPALSDAERHVLGVGDEGAEPPKSYRTPTLRQVASSGPYMHDGSHATLEDVLNGYWLGWDGGPYVDITVQPLDVDQGDLLDLEEFMRALEGAPLDYCWVNVDPCCCDDAGAPLGTHPPGCEEHECP